MRRLDGQLMNGAIHVRDAEVPDCTMTLRHLRTETLNRGAIRNQAISNLNGHDNIANQVQQSSSRFTCTTSIPIEVFHGDLIHSLISADSQLPPDNFLL